MKANNEKSSAAAKLLLNTYNTVVSLVWTTISFVPVIIFCYRYVSTLQLILICGVAMLSLFLPRIFFDRLRVSRSTGFYKKAGIGLVNKFSQNGSYIHRLLKKRFPEYKAVTRNPAAIESLFNQTYVFEKFHFAAALFFLFLAILALFNQLFWWSVGFNVINLFYNAYPILLQQYIRLKLQRFGSQIASKNLVLTTKNRCRTIMPKAG